MFIRVMVFIIGILLPSLSWAGEMSPLFHRFILEGEVGDTRHGRLYGWDLDGWVGGDIHKLHFKSEGEKRESTPAEQAEFWAMYSRNIGTFWDAQLGIRIDEQPEPTSHMVVGFEGLAPYFFETAAHLFISEDGDLTARIRQENDLLITQRLFIQPYIELNVAAQDVKRYDVGAGITSGEYGIQTRYEIYRKFAPYIDIRYENKFAETASIAKKHGEERDDFIASIGIRFMF